MLALLLLGAVAAAAAPSAHLWTRDMDVRHSWDAVPAGFELVGGTITTWKVQGKVGGYTK